MITAVDVLKLLIRTAKHFVALAEKMILTDSGGQPGSSKK